MLELLWSLYRPAAAIIKEFLKRSVLHIGIVKFLLFLNEEITLRLLRWVHYNFVEKFISKMTTMIGESMQFRHYQRFRIRYIVTIYDIQRSFLDSFQHNV